jgi:hypothetical protein
MPSRNIGTARTARKLPSFCPSDQVYSGSACTSGIWTIWPSSSARPMAEPRSGAIGTSSGVFDEFAGVPVGRGAKEHSFFLPSDHSVVGVTKSGGRFDQRIKHRLQIESRAADDLEDVGGRRLLLPRLGEFPHARPELLFQIGPGFARPASARSFARCGRTSTAALCLAFRPFARQGHLDRPMPRIRPSGVKKIARKPERV